MNFPDRSYPAKVLLFGEHTVLLGGSALAMPFQKYNCTWITDSDNLEAWWQDFLIYLQNNCSDFLETDKLNLIYPVTPLEWNIPIGYGLGSSGAITAAIFDYAAKIKPYTLLELQKKLGLMESYFHGKSSGYDPLISYQNTGIYKKGDQMAPWNYELSGRMFCYLVDSGVTRSGKNLIEEFRTRAISFPDVYDQIKNVNNHIIETIASGEEDIFYAVNELSQLQYDHMNYMIVDSIKSIWADSLERKDIAFKICGAGGGGYYLVMSQKPLGKLGNFVLELITQP